MATLVTGGTGFVGSNIIRELAQRGHNVISLDIAPVDQLVVDYLAPWADQIVWIQGDLLDQGVITRLQSQHSIKKIIHAAVYTAVRDDIEIHDSRKVVDINIGGTMNLLDLAKNTTVDRFVYVSSGGVYEGMDPSYEPLSEDMLLRPTLLYNTTKYASELIALRYGELHKFEVACVRLGGPYGPMERVTGHRAVMSLMHSLTAAIVKDEPIPTIGNSQRDFTYVLDIATGLATVLDAPTLPNRIYNLSRGVAVSRNDILDVLTRISPNIQITNPPIDTTIAEDSSMRGRVMDSARIQHDFDFSPQYDLLAGISDYIKWRHEYNYLA